MSFYGTASYSMVLFRILLISVSLVNICYSKQEKNVPLAYLLCIDFKKQSSAHLTGLLFNIFFDLLNYKINVGVFSPLFFTHCIFLEFANTFSLFSLLYPLG